MARSSSFLVSLLAFAMAASAGSGQNPAAAPKPPVTIEAVKAGWKARQERLERVQIAWTTRSLWTKGSMSAMVPDGLGLKSGFGPGKIVPPMDVRAVQAHSLRVDGRRLAYGQRGQRWCQMNESLIADDEDGVFDGDTVRSQMPSGVGKAFPYPQGRIRKDLVFAAAISPSVRPVLWHLRPVDPVCMPWRLDEFRVAGRTERIEGEPCVVLERPVNGTVGFVLWLDENAGFAIRQAWGDLGRGGGVRHVIRYRQTAQGPMPATFQFQQYGAGKTLQVVYEGEVGEPEAGAESERSAFQLEFKPGAYVADDKTGNWYILRADGTKRMVPSNERRFPYDKLLNSQPGELAPRPRRRSWALALLVAAVLLATGVVAYRRAAKRRTPQE